MTGVIAKESSDKSPEKAEWIFLAKLSDVPEGDIGFARHPTRERMTLAIYCVEGEIYVTSDRCTHGAASLSEEGELDGYQVECGWHNGRFDIRNGAALTMPCRTPLPYFETRLDGDDVYINPTPKRFRPE